MYTRAEVSKKITSTLSDLFEVDPEAISESALLYEDLDIDSIDAVDLIIELKSFTGLVIDPDNFKSVKTIEDVINIVCKLLENDINSKSKL
jgi:acyl carrier protein|tara:strand:- start:418 stop:690 length:273 start_codon:yes stop_codon:yes gene_type:complete